MNEARVRRTTASICAAHSDVFVGFAFIKLHYPGVRIAWQRLSLDRPWYKRQAISPK
jgi:hypothetical protein